MGATGEKRIHFPVSFEVNWRSLQVGTRAQPYAVCQQAWRRQWHWPVHRDFGASVTSNRLCGDCTNSQCKTGCQCCFKISPPKAKRTFAMLRTSGRAGNFWSTLPFLGIIPALQRWKQKVISLIKRSCSPTILSPCCAPLLPILARLLSRVISASLARSSNTTTSRQRCLVLRPLDASLGDFGLAQTAPAVRCCKCKYPTERVPQLQGGETHRIDRIPDKLRVKSANPIILSRKTNKPYRKESGPVE